MYYASNDASASTEGISWGTERMAEFLIDGELETVRDLDRHELEQARATRRELEQSSASRQDMPVSATTYDGESYLTSLLSQQVARGTSSISDSRGSSYIHALISPSYTHRESEIARAHASFMQDTRGVSNLHDLLSPSFAHLEPAPMREYILITDEPAEPASPESTSGFAFNLHEQAPGQNRDMMFPWWHKFIFHSNVRLENRESLLIDVGAVGNLCGSMWASRMELEGNKASQGTSWQDLDKSIELEGVGKNSSQARQQVTIPIRLENGDQGQYQAIVVEGELPALLGLDALTRHHAIICCETKRLIFPGPGGYKLALSPGSKILRLYTAPTGHLMLPCAEWNRQATGNAKPVSL